MTTPFKRIPRSWVIRVVGSALVLTATFAILPIGEVWQTMSSIPPLLWTGVLLAFLGGHVIAATKWWLLTSRHADIPFATAIRAHFAGLAANLCLPGIAGGDVVRAGLVLQPASNKARVAIGSLADRFLDSFALLALSAAGALTALGPAIVWRGPLLAIGSVLFVAAAAIILALIIVPRLSQSGIVEKITSVMTEFRRMPGRLLFCFGLSISVQAVFVGLNVALGAASAVDAQAAHWFFAWPLAKLVAIVPISISGLGVREASLATMLTPFGADAAKVVAVGLVWQTILFASGLLGGIAFALSMRRERARQAGPV